MRYLCLAGVGCILLFAWTAHAQDPRVNPQAAVLQEYQDRIQEYLKLRKAAAKATQKQRNTDDAEAIRAAQNALASQIREARRSAKQGDIFTPEIARHLRGLLHPVVEGTRGGETKAAIEDVQPSAMPLKVNSRYPDDQPRPMMPPNVLARLPRLPDPLEYRIVKGHLILRDVDANLIVDFIPNAVRRR